MLQRDSSEVFQPNDRKPWSSTYGIEANKDQGAHVDSLPCRVLRRKRIQERWTNHREASMLHCGNFLWGTISSPVHPMQQSREVWVGIDETEMHNSLR